MNDYYKGSRTFHIAIILGISIGAFCLILGFIIIILGISGSIEWVFEAGGFTSKLANAGPGVVFAIIGLIIIWRYKPKVTRRITTKPIKDSNGKERIIEEISEEMEEEEPPDEWENHEEDYWEEELIE
jgi:hypothetical protein